jgi:hypothetical protein
MRVVGSQQVSVSALGATSINTAALGAHGVYVAASSAVAGTLFRLFDAVSGTILSDTLMSAQVGDASAQFPLTAFFPLFGDTLTIFLDVGGPVLLRLVFTDEPPRLAEGRWPHRLVTTTLAASASLVVTTNTQIGRTARISGLLKSTRAGVVTVTYGNTDDITWATGNFLSIAGATGGVTVANGGRLAHPWTGFTIVNSDAALPNTLSLFLYADTAAT